MKAVTQGGSPADAFAPVADLDLIARIIVDGLVSGPHRSPFHGYSAEFSQYRHYQQGDDLKYVDWKLVARTDRVYTKQFRETTNMAASFVVDASASMAFPEGLSKFRYATIVAAALAHLVSRQGDAVGLRHRRREPGRLPASAGRPPTPQTCPRRAVVARGCRFVGRRVRSSGAPPNA
jgi:uncharacterized protein (DUF58 family)